MLIIIIVVLLSFSYQKAKASNWQLFGGNNDLVFYVDKMSIKRLNDTIYRAKVKFYNSKTDELALTKFEISCSENQFRIVEVVAYLKDGSIDRNTEKTSWKNINSDPGGAYKLYQIVCKTK